MGRLRPLSDAWLYWDAERLEGYPHSDSVHDERTQSRTGPGGNVVRKPLRLRLLEDLLIYVTGIVSALVGVGLAVLVGSFIAAYSALSEVNRSASQSILAYPPDAARRTLLADVATAARKAPVAVALSERSPERPRTQDGNPATTDSTGSRAP